MAMMNIHGYAKRLMQSKGEEPSVLRFLGAKWIVLKVLLVGLGTAAVLDPHVPAKCVGTFLFGYVLGIAAADIRRYLSSKQWWPIQQQVYDWGKIELLAREAPESVGRNA